MIFHIFGVSRNSRAINYKTKKLWKRYALFEESILVHFLIFDWLEIIVSAKIYMSLPQAF